MTPAVILYSMGKNVGRGQLMGSGDGLGECIVNIV